MVATRETVNLLYRIGMMAAWRGDTVDARTILEGLQISRPESSFPCIGLGVAYLNEGRLGSAIRILEAGLELDPECDQARWHLALACKIAGYESRSRQLCEDVLAAGRDPISVDLATMLLAIPAGDGKPALATA